ncbi:type II toxin-antitoxin system VapC family toxin [Spongiibacter sp. KMU-158]|uniref:Ribonuclease VapC n=2 Tax=Spongiibacter pelagi TaxID=2760804 RepID=A0A927C0D9_9GAMM|nr:type II toxin-antitoxin system VapC family toxin [Spongiibacter pelagi]
MLDTCICSFIMREHPEEVLRRMQTLVESQHRLVISAITYAEMKYGSIGKKASPKHATLVEEFVKRLDAILAWDRDAVDAATEIKRQLSESGTPIGANDTAIAGHAIATSCILVTNNTREFSRVPGLNYEDWVH